MRCNEVAAGCRLLTAGWPLPVCGSTWLSRHLVHEYTMSNEGSKTARLTIEDIESLIAQTSPNGNFELIDYNIEPFSDVKLGYLGKYELLTICARAHKHEEAQILTLTYFIKSLLPTANTFDRMIFEEEKTFYRDVVPEMLRHFRVQHWAPYSYTDKHDLFVLEDLRAQGYKCIKNLNENQLKSAIVSIARFHACSFLLESKHKKPLNEVYPGFFEEKVFLDDEDLPHRWLSTGAEVAEAVAKKLNLNSTCVSKAYQLMLKNVKRVAGERNVLIHGDLWANNMMFNDKASCRLIDFQMVHYGSYAIDLVQFLYLNINSKEIRNNVEKELVVLYHLTLVNILRNNGLEDDQIVTLEELHRNLDEKRISGLVTAIQFFPIAMMNEQMALKYTKDPERMHIYQYTSRKDFVLDGMKLDEEYSSKIEQCVIELIEFMEKYSRTK